MVFLWFYKVLPGRVLFPAGCLKGGWPLKCDAKCSSGCLASSSGGFLFNSYSKLMQNTLLAACILLWWFLVQFLFKTDAKCYPPQWWFLIQFLFKTDVKCSLHCLGSSCGGFLFHSYSKLLQSALWTAWLLLWLFLIQFLFKIDAKCSLDCLGSSCGGFLFNSYSK